MNDLHFTRRASPPTAGAIWRGRLLDWSPGFAVLAALVVVAGALFSRQFWQARDAANGQLRTGQAIVVGKAVSDLRGRAGNGYDIKLRLAGQTVTAHSYNLTLLNRINPGETVTAAYIVGKSGQIYVTDLAESDSKLRVGTSPGSRQP